MCSRKNKPESELGIPQAQERPAHSMSLNRTSWLLFAQPFQAMSTSITSFGPHRKCSYNLHVTKEDQGNATSHKETEIQSLQGSHEQRVPLPRPPPRVLVPSDGLGNAQSSTSWGCFPQPSPTRLYTEQVRSDNEQNTTGTTNPIQFLLEPPLPEAMFSVYLDVSVF